MHIPTEEDMERDRRNLVIYCATIALRVAGPDGLSCARLAEVLGIRANGLGGYFVGDRRIIKGHRREKGATHSTTYFRLAEFPTPPDRPVVVHDTAKA